MSVIDQAFRHGVNVNGGIFYPDQESFLFQRLNEQSMADTIPRIYHKFNQEVKQEKALIRDKYANLKEPSPATPGVTNPQREQWVMPQGGRKYGGAPSVAQVAPSAMPRKFTFGFKK